MNQSTINQRLKILIEKLGLSVRSFSALAQVSPNNTQNYLGKRQIKPKREYLDQVMRHFSHINETWLLTGEGEPFSTIQPSDQSTTATVKKNSGVIGPNGTQLTIKVPGNLDDCKQQLAVLIAENEGLRSTVAALETALSAKEEILTLLRVGHTRPN